MPHLESKTKLIMTASVNKYINPQKIVISDVCLGGVVPSRVRSGVCTFGHLPWLFMPHYADYVLALNDTVVPSRVRRLCCTFGHLPWLFMPHNITTHKSQFPRSYCHPTQPILQLFAHILLKIRLRLPYNHTHLLTHEQAPSER